jgi:hypothetical protein
LDVLWTLLPFQKKPHKSYRFEMGHFSYAFLIFLVILESNESKMPLITWYIRAPQSLTSCCSFGQIRCRYRCMYTCFSA